MTLSSWTLARVTLLSREERALQVKNNYLEILMLTEMEVTMKTNA